MLSSVTGKLCMNVKSFDDDKKRVMPGQGVRQYSKRNLERNKRQDIET